MAEMGSSSSAGLSPGKTDDAETFSESDLTLRHTDSRVSNGQLEMGLTAGSSLSRTSDDSSASLNDNGDGKGFILNPNTDLESIEVTVSANTSIAGDAYFRVKRLSDGQIVASSHYSTGVSAGDVLKHNVSLSAGTDYGILLDQFDSGETFGYLSSPSFNYNTTDFDITNGLKDGTTKNNFYSFNDIVVEKKATSATTYVEWSRPTDLRSWDRAIFTRVLDTETADVYIEEDDGTGWTEIAGPISTGDEIPAKSANKVRYRIDFSRANTANNPHIESIYRRYII